ncbi:MAG TPA: glycosyltransferase [Candidatus Didemnitutus sp.]|jgi:glycosyltransferase involved in cell wall biosynthesis
MNAGPLLFDASHTSHTRAQTGIQRVCRSLFAELQVRENVLPVCFDPHFGDWRTLDRQESGSLADRTGAHAAASRGARWALGQKIVGRVRRLAGHRGKLPPARGLVCAELFSARVGRQLPRLFSPVSGPAVAVFHDAIGLRLPELTPPATVARLPGYLRELLAFDGVAAVSEDSAMALRDFWHWLGVSNPPPVVAIPLGTDPVTLARPTMSTMRARVLCVATIEGRKNHAALLEAAELLWSEGAEFDLELIGLMRPATAESTVARARALKDSGRPVFLRGAVSDAALHEAYARCSFTVYPSLLEGFGLPVIESLRHGKPCVCANTGALGEAARDGGCLTVDLPDASSLRLAMRRLLSEPVARGQLADEARGRIFRGWSDYAGDLSDWMRSLPRRR